MPENDLWSGGCIAGDQQRAAHLAAEGVTVIRKGTIEEKTIGSTKLVVLHLEHGVWLHSAADFEHGRQARVLADCSFGMHRVDVTLDKLVRACVCCPFDVSVEHVMVITLNKRRRCVILFW